MGSSRYEDAHRRSLEDPEGFWGEAAGALIWDRPWDRVLDAEARPHARWFSGGRLNTCANALDRHVAEGRGEQAALIHDSPLTGTLQQFSYAELLEAVSRFAGALASLGVGKGDRVLLYMPMVPESVVGMLACARLGAVHSVVFGGFASKELATRIEDAEPKVILTASCGIEPNRVVSYQPLLEGALELTDHAPSNVVVFDREQQGWEFRDGRDHDWRALAAQADLHEPVSVEATDPLYILYTSGTTGVPKGVVRDNGGHAVALRWSLENVYGMKPGDVFWAASDIGWVVGHSYIVYAPLLLGCTTILYEGKPVGTPDPGAFWRVCAEHGVNALFTAPTAFRAIKREDPEAVHPGRYDLSKLRTLFLAGERADPDTVVWAEQALEIPVIDHWWQTESGWPMASNCIGIESLPIKHGSPTVAVPGWDVRVIDEQAVELPRGEVDEKGDELTGHIVVKLPLPPGCLTTLWNNDSGCESSYFDRFPGYYQSGDAGHCDEDGYLWIMSRTDDIINVAGHRLSTGGMEEILAGHHDVAECAVIGVKHGLKGQLPVGFAVLNAGCERDPEQIDAELVQLIRDKIGPVASFKHACIVRALPKTRSGKILRRVMRSLADGEPCPIPPTIEDPAVVDEIGKVIDALDLD